MMDSKFFEFWGELVKQMTDKHYGQGSFDQLKQLGIQTSEELARRFKLTPASAALSARSR